MLSIAQEEKESVKVLREVIDLQLKKSNDYQNPNSNVKQAMHYRRGIDSIHDIIQGKVYRAQSLLESASTPGAVTNFESLEDTYKDMAAYASFAVSYLRGKMDGQDPDRDMFNKKKPSLGLAGNVGPGPHEPGVSYSDIASSEIMRGSIPFPTFTDSTEFEYDDGVFIRKPK